ncbi:Cyclophilin-like domain,Cyclophilin-type peptidyl-prolyl cis-trans isomerase domain [Cinara cedri]|uniref:Cyclophilin-like domain,Cyclophilin-type peptidyl-prolyl cis-trans isomerase domain n=1 Tax=Cinara cedri TaxID=506608 RepID=A0A5E4M586_9HEMI|nr:Cyclophilin-like domain,Cyclophilin-type peptidyl-prolyl cis-trans isomerase domain [Cinara cedri]
MDIKSRIAQSKQALYKKNNLLTLALYEAETGISYSFCQRIAKLNKLHNKIQLVHHLRPTDFEKRIKMVAHFITKIDEEPDFLNNLHYRSDFNPHWTEKIKNITQKVDNKAPFLNVGELYKPGILGKNAKRLLQMENENLTLIKTINIIYRKKGETDCSKPISMVQKKSNIVESTKAKNKIIFAENVRLFDKIYHAKPRIDFQEMEKEEKANKARLLLASKYPDYNKKTIYSGNENDLLISKSGLPKNIKIKKSKCYLDIDDLTADERMGRLTIEVYDDIVPKTASNFLKLCQNRDKPLGYKGSQFFHIVPGLFCLGGDVEYSVGLGGQSALDQRYFDDENYTLSHNATGTAHLF